MHFCAQQVRACQDDAYAQWIVRIAFSELCDYPRKVPLIDGIPRNGNHDCLTDIGSIGIRYAGLKRLSALRVDEGWSASPWLETDLIFHADAAEHGHKSINWAKIRFTRFILDFFPGNVKADAS